MENSKKSDPANGNLLRFAALMSVPLIVTVASRILLRSHTDYFCRLIENKYFFNASPLNNLLKDSLASSNYTKLDLCRFFSIGSIASISLIFLGLIIVADEARNKRMYFTARQLPFSIFVTIIAISSYVFSRFAEYPAAFSLSFASGMEVNIWKSVISIHFLGFCSTMLAVNIISTIRTAIIYAR